MATEPKPLDDLFHDMLKDVYYAEKQILKALPKMAKAAKSPELKKAFETHREETEGHVERLAEVFELIGKAPRGKTCDAILGIIEEGKAVIEDYGDSPAIVAGLVASAQAVEHYEMADMVPSRLGPSSSATRMRSSCSTRRSPRKRRPTRLSRSSVDLPTQRLSRRQLSPFR